MEESKFTDSEGECGLKWQGGKKKRALPKISDIEVKFNVGFLFSIKWFNDVFRGNFVKGYNFWPAFEFIC